MIALACLLLCLTAPAHAADLPVDPTLGAGKALVRFSPGSDGRWLASVYYAPPRGRPAAYTVRGGVAGTPVTGQGLATGFTRVATVSVDAHAPELSRLLEPVRVERQVTRDGNAYRVVLRVRNEGQHPALVRVTYLNWTRLALPDRTLEQRVSVRLGDREVSLQPFTLRGSTFVRADLTGSNAGSYHSPYARLKPGDALELVLTVTADRSPGKLLVARRVLLSEPPVPVTLQVEVRRPASYRLDGERVSFWVPGPGVRYEVECLVRRDGRLSLERVDGVSEHQGVVAVGLQGDPEFVSVFLRQPARVAFEVRDRVRLPLRVSSGRASGVRVSWRVEGDRARIALSGRGRVLLGLILDGTVASVRVNGGSVLESGTLPSGRAFVIVDAGTVERERVVVVEGQRVLDVLARVARGAS